MTFVKPSRTVTSASCAASSSPRLWDRQASRNWLLADMLWALDPQMLADASRVRNRKIRLPR